MWNRVLEGKMSTLSRVARSKTLRGKARILSRRPSIDHSFQNQTKAYVRRLFSGHDYSILSMLVKRPESLSRHFFEFSNLGCVRFLSRRSHCESIRQRTDGSPKENKGQGAGVGFHKAHPRKDKRVSLSLSLSLSQVGLSRGSLKGLSPVSDSFRRSVF